MKSKIWSLAIVAALLSVSGLTAEAEPAGRLGGTWRAEVVIRDCQTDAVLRTFPALLTFAFGGTLLETTTAFPPALRGPGHGYWRHVEGKAYTAVSEAFIFNLAGVWIGTQRLTQDIQFGDDPDEFDSRATNEIFDPSGNLIVAGCATAVAHPLE